MAEARIAVIRAGTVEIRVSLLETPTAAAIWRALPIRSTARTWGEEVYFDVPVSCTREKGAKDVVSAGEIAYWPDGEAIAIGFGQTPISRGDEIRLASPCNIWATALDDVTELGSVRAGDRIEVQASA
jgi:hypothetical protein